MGSVLFLASWAVLMGPITYAKHLASGPRLPFTAAYFGSIFLTLYFAVGVRHTLQNSLLAEPPPPLAHPCPHLHLFLCYSPILHDANLTQMLSKSREYVLISMSKHSGRTHFSPYSHPSYNWRAWSGIWSATSPWVVRACASPPDLERTGWRRG